MTTKEAGALASDSEVLKIMRDASVSFAQEQYFKHWRNDYNLAPEDVSQHTARWKYIERRISELIQELRAARAA